MSELTREQVEAIAKWHPCDDNAASIDLATALLAAWDAVEAAQTYINDVLGVPSPDFLATIAAREATEGGS